MRKGISQPVALAITLMLVIVAVGLISRIAALEVTLFRSRDEMLRLEGERVREQIRVLLVDNNTLLITNTGTTDVKIKYLYIAQAGVARVLPLNIHLKVAGGVKIPLNITAEKILVLTERGNLFSPLPVEEGSSRSFSQRKIVGPFGNYDGLGLYVNPLNPDTVHVLTSEKLLLTYTREGAFIRTRLLCPSTEYLHPLSNSTGYYTTKYFYEGRSLVYAIGRSLWGQGSRIQSMHFNPLCGMGGMVGDFIYTQGYGVGDLVWYTHIYGKEGLVVSYPGAFTISSFDSAASMMKWNSTHSMLIAHFGNGTYSTTHVFLRDETYPLNSLFLEQSQTDSSVKYHVSTTKHRIAQSFVPVYSGKPKITLRLEKLSEPYVPYPTAAVELRDSSFNLIERNTYLSSGFSFGVGDYNFTFRVELTAGRTYYIVFYKLYNTWDAYNLYASSANAYPKGTLLYSTDGGVSWADVGRDLCFKIYIEASLKRQRRFLVSSGFGRILVLYEWRSYDPQDEVSLRDRFGYYRVLETQLELYDYKTLNLLLTHTPTKPYDTFGQLNDPFLWRWISLPWLWNVKGPPNQIDKGMLFPLLTQNGIHLYYPDLLDEGVAWMFSYYFSGPRAGEYVRRDWSRDLTLEIISTQYGIVRIVGDGFVLYDENFNVIKRYSLPEGYAWVYVSPMRAAPDASPSPKRFNLGFSPRHLAFISLGRMVALVRDGRGYIVLYVGEW